jgi:hypothetical protein
LYLVGGFAASEWLFRVLYNALNLVGIAAGRPDSHMNKAVADGAVSFYLDRFVKTRVSKLTYGISCGIPYNSSNYEHLQRIHDMYEDFSGLTRIRNSFSVILAKGTAVAENTEFRCPYSRDRKKLAQLNYMSDPILGFYGAKAPSWVDTTDGSPLSYVLNLVSLSHPPS